MPYRVLAVLLLGLLVITLDTTRADRDAPLDACWNWSPTTPTPRWFADRWPAGSPPEPTARGCRLAVGD